MSRSKESESERGSGGANYHIINNIALTGYYNYYNIQCTPDTSMDPRPKWFISLLYIQLVHMIIISIASTCEYTNVLFWAKMVHLSSIQWSV